MSTPIDRIFIETTLDGQRKSQQQLAEQIRTLEAQLQQCRASAYQVNGAIQALEYVLSNMTPTPAEA